MRVIKDTTGQKRDLAIIGTTIVVKFQDNYAEVDDKYLHHVEFHKEYEIMPKGFVIPKIVDAKVKKEDNGIKAERLSKK